MSLRERLMLYARQGIRQARKLVILLIGSTVILIGIILIFTPGPALIVIPAGLAILSIEFAWARRWLKSMRGYLTKQVEKSPQGADSIIKP